MKQKNLKYALLSLVIIVAMSFYSELAAQCPMCRMSAESNLAHGGTEGKGLNRGILYMFAMPYLLVTTLGIIWWKNRQNVKEGHVDPLS